MADEQTYASASASASESEGEGEGEVFSDDESDNIPELTEGSLDAGEDFTIENATDFVNNVDIDEPCDFELIDEQSQIVEASKTIHTTEYITKFEKSRALGMRAQQIKSGAAVMLREDEKDEETGEYIFENGKYPKETRVIAEMELKYGRCPLIFGRSMPNGEKMMVWASKLKLI
jgi:hypothetical protein